MLHHSVHVQTYIIIQFIGMRSLADPDTIYFILYIMGIVIFLSFLSNRLPNSPIKDYSQSALCHQFLHKQVVLFQPYFDSAKVFFKTVSAANYTLKPHNHSPLTVKVLS